jgi:hypothetical protein
VSSNLKERIDFELDRLHQLFMEGGSIIDSSIITPPDASGRWALGGLMHAFYNGIENILKQISKEYDEEFGINGHWHSDLLKLMMQNTARRPSVVSPELYTILKKYLGFRHVFRSIYTHELRWENMKELVNNCRGAFDLFENEVRLFMKEMQGK